MTAERSRRLEVLFEQAVDLPLAKREAFLDRHCGDDADLRAELSAMLAADDRGTLAILGRPLLQVPGPGPSLEPGRRVGPYVVEARIGAGGMGTVYRVRVAETVAGLTPGRRAALKLIHPHLLDRSDYAERFRREADIGRKVRHSNVARTHAAGAMEINGTTCPFLVLEYVEGQTLGSLLRELDRVPEELGRHIGCEVAKGLAAIHAAGIVHRDLKPENVLITPEHRVKVMDLGVARLADETRRLSRTGEFVGSVLYAAPEQFGSASAEADGRTDLYALGLVLYELLTGRHPFAGDDVRQVFDRQLKETPPAAGVVNPQLSPFVEAVLETLLEKEKERRFASAKALLATLEEGEDSAWWRDRSRTIRAETGRPLRRIRVPRETALYGRDEELMRLRRLFAGVKAGEGGVVLVEGEAGIGKTRLVDEFVGRLREEGEDPNFLFGSYPPGGAATAQGAFATAYREHFGREGLEATLASYLTNTPLLVPAFAALLRGEIPPDDAERLTKDSLQTAFVHATRALSAERPTIVLIEDLHFASEEGRGLFASLALAVPGHRILLVGTGRHGLPADWAANLERQEHVSRLELSRLGAKDLVHLLEDAFQSKRLAEELGVRIIEKSDGNPFFVFEIIRGLREGQLIKRLPDGTWVTSQVIRDIEVPSTVTDLIQARISGLDALEKDLLDVAACCGYEFDPLLVAAAVGLDRTPALKRLARIEKDHRLVRSAGRRFVFDHHQVQETLYRALPELLREDYHTALAEALEARTDAASREPNDLEGALCVELCEHFLTGGQGGRALRYLDAALRHLDARYLHGRAIGLAGAALAVPSLVGGAKRSRLLFGQGDRLGLVGLSEQAERVVQEALTLAREAGDRRSEAAATGNLGNIFESMGRLAEAQECHEQNLAIARQLGDVQSEATALGNLGVVLFHLGRYEEAKELYERHLHLAQEMGDLAAEARATGNLGGVHWARGDYTEAKELFERRLLLAREMGNRRLEAGALGDLGVVLYSMGLHEEARESYERALALALEIGDRRSEARTRGNLGVLAEVLGRTDEARTCHEHNLGITRELGDRRGEATATGNLANVLQALGLYEEAQRLHERHLTLAREVGHRAGEALALGNLGCVLSDRGLWAEAATFHEQQLALAQEIGDRGSENLATGNLGGLFLLLGQPERAREHLERSLDLARDRGNPETEVKALNDLAILAGQSRDDTAAARLFREALEILRRTGMRAEEADCLLARAAFLIDSSDQAGARSDIEAATAITRRLDLPGPALLATAWGAVAFDGRVPAALQALGEHEDRVRRHALMEARFLLWRATCALTHLAEARRLLDHLVEHAPPEYRESMLKNVRLHREIMEAWAEHGEKAREEAGE